MKRNIVLVLTFAMLIGASTIALTRGSVNPPVRNIIYFHVPSSIGALGCFLVLLIASIAYLARGGLFWDHLAAAAGEVGLACATVFNLTGMIFSRAEWNVWWTPSLRLITSAVLWFLYVAYLLLRQALPPARRGRMAAVFGIIAFLDVPLVFISARLIPDIHRASFSFSSAWQSWALGLMLLGTMVLAGQLIWTRLTLLNLKHHLDEQELIEE